jgi:hypothetical protein
MSHAVAKVTAGPGDTLPPEKRKVGGVRPP